MKPLNPLAALPLYAQAEVALRALVREVGHQAGQLLPRETDLAMRLGVSRHTIRVAMDSLVREGLILRKKGVGTVVNRSPIQTRLTEWTSFSREMGRLGRELVTLEKRVWVEPAPEAAAAGLGIAPGTKVIVLERLKGEEGQPVVLFRSWFHPRLSIPETEAFDGPLYELIENRYQVVPAISEECIGALGAGAPDRARLQMPEDLPMLYRKRTVSDVAGRPFEFGVAHYRSDRFEYSIRITRDGFSQQGDGP
ncbi:MAG: GntR family transcriptional regulator [Spirochaetales bacterium]